MLTTDFANRSSKLKASHAILDGKLHGSGMSHTTTASPKPFFRAPWRVDDGVVGRRNAGWTTSKSGHPCPCQNCSPGPPAEKCERGSLLNRPSCSPDDTIGQVTELNWTEYYSAISKCLVIVLLGWCSWLKEPLFWGVYSRKARICHNRSSY